MPLAVLSGDSSDVFSIRRGNIQFPDGKTLPIKQIGKGMFATAYATVGTKNKRVFVAVRDSVYPVENDYSKEIMEEAQGKGLTHLPKVKKLGDTNNAALYEMPFYKVPVRAQDGAAWQQYKVLKKCQDQAQRLTPYAEKTYDGVGYELSQKILSCVQLHVAAKKVPRTLYNSLKAVVDAGANYGAEYSLEFFPKNLGTDPKGRLILLDPIFSIRVVRQRQVAAARKMDSYWERMKRKQRNGW